MAEVPKAGGGLGDAQGTPIAPTFASLLKTPSLHSSPASFPPATCRSFKKEGKLALAFSKDDMERSQNYISSKAVVLKFSAERPHLGLVRNQIQKDWNVEGDFTMGLLDPRHILLTFENENEINKALSRYNCQVMGIRFKVFRWHSGFSFKQDPCLAPVWIDLPDLPLDFFYPSMLESIGNELGSFLSTDRETKKFTRPDVARICVEMEIQEEMPSTIWLEGPGLAGFWQPILYPSFLYCSFCSKIGHSLEHCRKKNTSSTLQKPRDKAPLNANNTLNSKNKQQNFKQTFDRFKENKNQEIYQVTGVRFSSPPSMASMERGETSNPADQENSGEDATPLQEQGVTKVQDQLNKSFVSNSFEILGNISEEDCIQANVFHSSSPPVFQSHHDPGVCGSEPEETILASDTSPEEGQALALVVREVDDNGQAYNKDFEVQDDNLNEIVPETQATSSCSLAGNDLLDENASEVVDGKARLSTDGEEIIHFQLTEFEDALCTMIYGVKFGSFSAEFYANSLKSPITSNWEGRFSDDPDWGTMVYIKGDARKEAAIAMNEVGIASLENIKIHRPQKTLKTKYNLGHWGSFNAAS